MYTGKVMASKHLNVSSEFLGNIAHNHLHLLQLLESKSRIFLFIVLFEMRNIFGVGQVRLGGIVSMVLLEMVDLVLILNVAMVPGTEAQVGQPLTRSNARQPILPSDKSRVSGIKQREHSAHSVLFLVFAHGRIGLVIQAVCFAYFVVGPLSGGVVVVKNEERGRVKGLNVVFLCNRGC